MIMKRPSLKNILDALTCDSSIEGCDPDWRSWVLDNANPDDIKFIKKQLEVKLPKEVTLTKNS
jgi:hypothetical protein